jgi:formiminoglutamase
MTSFIDVRRGAAPLLISVPHAGTDLPAEVAERVVSRELAIGDADWHMDRIYDFVFDFDATMVKTSISRTAIDVNRDPSGTSLYPGQATTELIPTTTFDGVPIYKPGCVPDAIETARRRAAYFDPYHAALQTEIDRLLAIHSRIVLYDCHSIRSIIPRLFEGELPVFNIGTNNGASADADLTQAIRAECAASGESLVVNGRFRGGWITRNYGRPERGVHTIQMELAQRIYMDESRPGVFHPARAEHAVKLLRPVLSAIHDWVKR